MNTAQRDFWVLVLINLNLAFDFAVNKVALNHVGPVTLLFWRYALCVPLFALLLRRGSAPSWIRSLHPGGWLILVFNGVVGFGVATIVYTMGIQRSLASTAALLFMAVPIMTAAFACLLLHERVTKTKALSFALAVLGFGLCLDIRWSPAGLFGGQYLVGNLLMLCAAVFWALSTVFARALLSRIPPMDIVAISSLLAFVTSIPFLLTWEPGGLWGAFSIPGVVWLTFFKLGTFWAISLWGIYWVMVRLEASQVAVSLYLPPIFGVVISALWLDEKLTAPILLGAVLICGAVYLATVTPRKQVRQEVFPEGSQ